MLIVIVFLTTAGPVSSQEYLWPTDASRLMTSSFCEYRAGHFHAGIDIKTWGRVGHKVFSIENGSVVRIRVSPYGYGRAVYVRLENGMTVVYAHLLRFAPPLEAIVKAEQKRRGRFAIQKYFNPLEFRVGRGEIIGYTGSSGNGVPHLHIDIRDEHDRPFNPLSLGFPIRDTIRPTITAVAVSPLSHGSHVDGDFRPQVYRTRQVVKGTYVIDQVIRSWGRVGFAVSAHDRADGAWNRFAPYTIRFFIDDVPVFSSRYDRFSFRETHLVELDRDYRLKHWGKGLFQKLYRDAGNTLSIYDPDSPEAGILYCWTEESEIDSVDYLDLNGGQDILLVPPGYHAFRIEVLDYYGNSSNVRGVLRMLPLAKVRMNVTSAGVSEAEKIAWGEEPPRLTIKRHLFQDYVYFRVQADRPLSMIPSLNVAVNSWKKSVVALHAISPDEYAGALPWGLDQDALMISSLDYSEPGHDAVALHDTLHVFRITPEGGRIVSPDGACRLDFPPDAAYEPLLGACEQAYFEREDSVIPVAYTVYPQDVLLKRSPQIRIAAHGHGEDPQGLGIYAISSSGRAGYIGGSWEGGFVRATVGSLNRFTVLQDTIPPEITFIRPSMDSRIIDRTPQIAVGFEDTLSGISGEENYVVVLDNERLIIEYVPSKDYGFHQVETELTEGEHTVEVRIVDRAGNVAEKRSRFFIGGR